ncbi:MAG TPA: RES family NAD+ phosphorylase [Candidatus Polarisedimenticolaceae bacterium]|nr:RES family NAD+ phosphorylase [Candidatus Polarisedimenticolaceae bacterium]
MTLSGIKALSGKLWRVVEGQHVIATRGLVDSTEEHDLLERMIDAAKPAAPDEKEFAGLHYLLSTPFRYPPLRHGSRFATRHDRSIFYGSTELRSAFAETAYYRLLFLEGTAAHLEPVDTDLSAFQVGYRTSKGLDLTRDPSVSAPDRYDGSQKLGARMREAGVEAFRYASAREAEGVNVGLFTPRAFTSKRPGAMQVWKAAASRAAVEIRRHDLLHPETFVYPRQQFLVRGVLPRPAV